MATKSHTLALGQYFETNTTATKRTSYHWSTTEEQKQQKHIVFLKTGGTIMRPKQRQQIVDLTTGAPLRDQSNGNQSYILALGQYLKKPYKTL